MKITKKKKEHKKVPRMAIVAGIILISKTAPIALNYSNLNIIEIFLLALYSYCTYKVLGSLIEREKNEY